MTRVVAEILVAADILVGSWCRIASSLEVVFGAWASMRIGPCLMYEFIRWHLMAIGPLSDLLAQPRSMDAGSHESHVPEFDSCYTCRGEQPRIPALGAHCTPGPVIVTLRQFVGARCLSFVCSVM
jgi:hypothetical protein